MRAIYMIIRCLPASSYFDRVAESIPQLFFKYLIQSTVSHVNVLESSPEYLKSYFPQGTYSE